MAVPSGLAPVPTDHTAVARPGDPLPAPADVIRIRTIMGSTRRAGAWTVPFRLELKVLLGELVIDLRDAIFWSDVLDIELDVRARMPEALAEEPDGCRNDGQRSRRGTDGVCDLLPKREPRGHAVSRLRPEFRLRRAA